MTEINNVNNLQNKNLEFKSPDSVKPQEQEENPSIFFAAEAGTSFGEKIAESLKEDGTFPTAYELKETGKHLLEERADKVKSDLSEKLEAYKEIAKDAITSMPAVKIYESIHNKTKNDEE